MGHPRTITFEAQSPPDARCCASSRAHAAVIVGVLGPLREESAATNNRPGNTGLCEARKREDKEQRDREERDAFALQQAIALLKLPPCPVLDDRVGARFSVRRSEEHVRCKTGPVLSRLHHPSDPGWPPIWRGWPVRSLPDCP